MTEGSLTLQNIRKYVDENLKSGKNWEPIISGFGKIISNYSEQDKLDKQEIKDLLRYIKEYDMDRFIDPKEYKSLTLLGRENYIKDNSEKISLGVLKFSLILKLLDTLMKKELDIDNDILEEIKNALFYIYFNSEENKECIYNMLYNSIMYNMTSNFGYDRGFKYDKEHNLFTFFKTTVSDRSRIDSQLILKNPHDKTSSIVTEFFKKKLIEEYERNNISKARESSYERKIKSLIEACICEFDEDFLKQIVPMSATTGMHKSKEIFFANKVSECIYTSGKISPDGYIYLYEKECQMREYKPEELKKEINQPLKAILDGIKSNIKDTQFLIGFFKKFIKDPRTCETHIDLFETLITAFPDNINQEQHDTILNLVQGIFVQACKEGKHDLLDKILSIKNNIYTAEKLCNEQYNEDFYPIVHFAKNCDRSSMELICKYTNPPFFNIKVNKTGNNILHEIADGELERAGRITKSKHTSEETLKCLCDKLDSEGFKELLLQKNKEGETPLHIAIKKRNVEFIKTLLDKKIYEPFFCAKNRDGKTPIQTIKEQHLSDTDKINKMIKDKTSEIEACQRKYQAQQAELEQQKPEQAIVEPKPEQAIVEPKPEQQETYRANEEFPKKDNLQDHKNEMETELKITEIFKQCAKVGKEVTKDNVRQQIGFIANVLSYSVIEGVLQIAVLTKILKKIFESLGKGQQFMLFAYLSLDNKLTPEIKQIFMNGASNDQKNAYVKFENDKNNISKEEELSKIREANNDFDRIGNYEKAMLECCH